MGAFGNHVAMCQSHALTERRTVGSQVGDPGRLALNRLKTLKTRPKTYFWRREYSRPENLRQAVPSPLEALCVGAVGSCVPAPLRERRTAFQ